MTIGELFDKINAWPEDTMNFRIIAVFSWRGVYAEAAAEISTETTLKAYNLDMLREAINISHCGWKGGSFEYDFDTNIHFECDYGSWTGGKYLKNFLQRNWEEPVIKYIFNEEI